MIIKFKLFESSKDIHSLGLGIDDIKNSAISIENADEAFEATELLLSIGIHTASETPEIAKNRYIVSNVKSKWTCKYNFYVPCKHGFQMSVSSGDYSEINMDTFRELVSYIKKLKKIENPDMDPYGEEDWGYELSESVQDEIDPDDLIGKKVILIKKDFPYYDNKGNKYGKSSMIIGRVGIINHISIIGKKDDKMILIGLGPLSAAYYDIRDFKIIKTKRVHTEYDPYGEEDWEYESVHNDVDPYGEENWYENIFLEDYFESVKNYIDYQAILNNDDETDIRIEFTYCWPIDKNGHTIDYQFFINDIKGKAHLWIDNYEKSLELENSNWMTIRSAMDKIKKDYIDHVE